MHRLARVVPVLERLGKLKILDSLGHLNELSGKSPVVVVALLDRLEAGPHYLAIPLFGEL